MSSPSPTASRLTRKNWPTLLTVVIGTAVSAWILAAYSSYTRPIWIDEFLHYALGSHRSTAEAWRSISETLPTFNHGQTGIHMLVNYWMLDAFGASAVVLRLPSVLCAAFLLFSAVQIAMRLRFHPGWVLALLASFFCQQNLMHFAGEARPYMPLAAATMGILAFLLVPVEERTKLGRLGGIVSLAIGTAFHPYFAPYWLGVAIFTYIMHGHANGWRDGITRFIRHCDPWLSIPAAVFYLTLAKFTWMRGSPDFNLDPFQWIRGDGLFTTFAHVSHFQFLGQAYLLPFAALVAGISAAFIPEFRRSSYFRRMMPPLGLLAMTLGMSVFLSAVSYHREYWILPRQWVASMALCCLATVWLAREMTAGLRGRWRLIDLSVLAVFMAILYPTFRTNHQAKAPEVLAVWQAVTGKHDHPKAKPGEAPAGVHPANNEEWVQLANLNIAAGGPVWPIFRRFYARPD